MELTIEMLRERNVCNLGLAWFQAKALSTLEETFEMLIEEKRWGWGLWLLQFLSPEDNTKIAIYGAKVVLPIFQKNYPDDGGPANNILAAETWLASPTKRNAELARAVSLATSNTSTTIHAAQAAVQASYSAYAAYSAIDKTCSAAIQDAATCALFASYSAQGAADIDDKDTHSPDVDIAAAASLRVASTIYTAIFKHIISIIKNAPKNISIGV